MIAIIDYDAGNLRSVEKALEAIGQEAVVTRDRNEILSSDKVILPGVGSFGDAMGRLNEYGLVNTIHEVVDSGKPFLGICLGLQLLFKTSEESPEALRYRRAQDFLKVLVRILMCILYTHIISRLMMRA